MKEHMRQFTLRLDDALLQKLGYIAEYEGRTKNKEIQQLIRQHVIHFEQEHGCIELLDQEEEADII
ncbi:MAG: TraY domain-containing protein [Oscillospiraceae bacterium]|nr:TraY domain-containing protein [Oscillospiraceae bacterium]